MPARIAICLVVVFSAAVGRSLGEQAEVEAVARPRAMALRSARVDAVVEIKAQAALKDIYSALATWAARHYKGDWVTSGQLDQAAGKAGDRALTAVGLGSPPVESVKEDRKSVV